MNDQMMQGMQYHMIIAAALFVLSLVMIFAILVFFLKSAPSDNLLVADIAATSGDPFFSSLDGTARSMAESSALAHDTIFILPDISHYTRFMTGNRFAFAHAQHIIFCLINAMINAATKKVELSKLEGDAALFFVDAQQHSKAEIGETVMDIFRAFFKERKRLMDANICPCRACRHVNELDLKVFVHRGQAARFRFRGSVDHFGTDVIILHRIMKNGVSGHRYVMVTEAAAESIKLPGECEIVQVEEAVEDVGSVRASVYEISDAMAAELSELGPAQHLPKLTEACRKLRGNLRTIQTAMRSGRQRA